MSKTIVGILREREKPVIARIHNRFSIYAAQHDLIIVRTYTDEGRSGLRIHRRDGLIDLIDDVRGGRADFDYILVYDVSRW